MGNDTLGTASDWRQPGAGKATDDKVYEIPFKATMRGFLRVASARNKKAAFSAARAVLRNAAVTLAGKDAGTQPPAFTAKKQSVKVTKK